MSRTRTAGCRITVGGVIPEESSLLLATEPMFRGMFGIEVRTGCEAVSISPRTKTVDLRNVATGAVTTESYDKLVLSPGAAPIRPSLPGIDLPGIFSLRTVPDARTIRKWLERGTETRSGLDSYTGLQVVTKPKRAVVVGGGFIGLEMVENFAHLGLRGDAHRKAGPGHAAARPRDGAPRRALHGQARRQARAR